MGKAADLAALNAKLDRIGVGPNDRARRSNALDFSDIETVVKGAQGRVRQLRAVPISGAIKSRESDDFKKLRRRIEETGEATKETIDREKKEFSK